MLTTTVIPRPYAGTGGDPGPAKAGKQDTEQATGKTTTGKPARRATRAAAQDPRQKPRPDDPPTAKTEAVATVTGISIDRLAGGKIVESWGEFDLAGMLMQMGVTLPKGG